MAAVAAGVVAEVFAAEFEFSGLPGWFCELQPAVAKRAKTRVRAAGIRMIGGCPIGRQGGLGGYGDDSGSPLGGILFGGEIETENGNCSFVCGVLVVCGVWVRCRELL